MRRKIFLGVIIAAIVFSFSSIAHSEWDKKNKEELFRQVDLYSSALAIIQANYVDEVKPKDLIYGSLTGMLNALDAHSQFMDPDTYNELKVDTEGKFGGLGIEITVRDGLLTVVTPIEDTPAWKIGIKAGDRLVKIGDQITRDMTLSEAVKKLRGKPGEAVTITVLRESEKKLIEFKIVRDIIKIKDIKEAKILEDGIGYLRLVEFRENTARDFEAALDNLRKQKMTAFILDLRNNPGGLLDDAVKVAECFIEKDKLIVYTKSRDKSQDLRFVSHARNPLLDIPIVVLVNEGSASGSEIVAAALQDYKRAVIIGTKSFGKGSVQTIIPLSDGSALRLTTSRYFTPSGKVIHEKGVMPDIIIEQGRVETTQEKIEKVDKSEDVFKEIDPKADKEKKDVFDYKIDRQIMGAIDALKAILIYKDVNKNEKSNTAK